MTEFLIVRDSCWVPGLSISHCHSPLSCNCCAISDLDVAMLWTNYAKICKKALAFRTLAELCWGSLQHSPVPSSWLTGELSLEQTMLSATKSWQLVPVLEIGCSNFSTKCATNTQKGVGFLHPNPSVWAYSAVQDQWPPSWLKGELQWASCPIHQILSH